MVFLSRDPLPHVRSWLEKGHRKSTAWVSGSDIFSNLIVTVTEKIG